MTTPLLHGLPPIIDDGARVLILGNMPSVMSLAARQYYTNPRNGFWRITGEIFGFRCRRALRCADGGAACARYRSMGRTAGVPTGGQS